MSASDRPVFILDIDNTLLDNDALKEDLDAGVRAVLGEQRAARFWEIYEEVRVDRQTVDLPATIRRLTPELGDEALAERLSTLIMDYPFVDRVYPEVPQTLATLRTHGTPVIVSDGDAVYQPRKIERSGLAAAVRGQVRVYIHKEEHLDEILRLWPAPYYVMIDDKARILAETKRLMPERFVTVHVRQGHYGMAPDTFEPAPDISLGSIGDVRRLPFAELERHLHPAR